MNLESLLTFDAFMHLFSLSLVKGSCNIIQYCYDPQEVLNSIKVNMHNYQQLLNAFYPINQAKPSSAILAYFTNYTAQLPPECSQGTYPSCMEDLSNTERYLSEITLAHVDNFINIQHSE